MKKTKSSKKIVLKITMSMTIVFQMYESYSMNIGRHHLSHVLLKIDVIKPRFIPLLCFSLAPSSLRWC